MKIKLKVLDIFIILTVLATIVLSVSLIGANTTSAANLIVTVSKNNSSSQEKYIFSMKKDGEYEIYGKIGKSIIYIRDGKAGFLESCCPNNNCVLAGSCSHSGDWNACLPNGIFISIEGADNELDAVSR